MGEAAPMGVLAQLDALLLEAVAEVEGKFAALLAGCEVAEVEVVH